MPHFSTKPSIVPRSTMASTISSLEWALISGEDILDTSSDIAQLASSLQQGDYKSILRSEFLRSILSDSAQPEFHFSSSLRTRIDEVTSQAADDVTLFKFLLIGVAGLNAFLQSNVTGPPLSFRPEELLLPWVALSDKKRIDSEEIKELTVEGEAVYPLIPHVLLFSLARTIICHPALAALETTSWWRFRINFLHQRMLEGDKTDLLHENVYKDLKVLSSAVGKQSNWVRARLLLEKARVNTFYGYDKAALEELEEAASETGLQYALTGALGKRTKFQERDLSQLVVLAKSAEEYKGNENGQPTTLDLNDDTLLESIAFTKEKPGSQTTTITDGSHLPEGLAQLDLDSQPPLHPLDATILLLLTETIKNTNPNTGITREEMAPYAERVLQHSTNWEVYTIGLLVRSRIEGYKARTAERGVLQLQTLVDQVIAETTLSDGAETGASTFLPRPKSEEESAPVRERLKFIYQLPAPTRWEIEAELANRWVSLGGLRTALEIYTRLEMWAEVALCWAATEREDKARRIVRDQLMHPVAPPAEWQQENDVDEYNPTPEEELARREIIPRPNNAPRLWCILGDIENNYEHYEKAWDVSNHRYARAKRSLGRYWFGKKEYLKSAEAYAASLNVNQINKESWFSLGCCRLELQDYEGAVEAFQRTTMLDDEDAEAWSNLAASLLRRRAPVATEKTTTLDDDEEDVERDSQNRENVEQQETDVTRSRKDALKALQQACRLKFDNWRIWENMLIIAASVPSYNEVVMAMSRIIDIRGPSAGETCIDVEIVEHLVQHVMSTIPYSEAMSTGRSNLAKATIDLVDNKVVPLITKQHRLWLLCSRLALYRKRPKEALECQEKAFRIVSRAYEINESTWNDFVEATVDMVDAYTSLGEMEREGFASGSGELVAKDWKFKARSVLRKAMGKGRTEGKDVEPGWEKLEASLESLKG
ncbi:hypothetical protein BDZ91DRAFT_708619 [Kalaharituber pfeilii]|nr:hypothetical protein BDZ91DRAFT_708619 [Kalaharituber pfeilii]